MNQRWRPSLFKRKSRVALGFWYHLDWRYHLSKILDCDIVILDFSNCLNFELKVRICCGHATRKFLYLHLCSSFLSLVWVALHTSVKGLFNFQCPFSVLEILEINGYSNDLVGGGMANKKSVTHFNCQTLDVSGTLTKRLLECSKPFKYFYSFLVFVEV